MEDEHIHEEKLDEDVSFFAVLDGHGGTKNLLIAVIGQGVATLAKEDLPQRLKNTQEFKDKEYKDALTTAFVSFDEYLESEPGRTRLEEINSKNPTISGPDIEGPNKPELADFMGTTACAVLLTKDKIYVANTGDSRCVACYKNEARALSSDHKPYLEKEKYRIREAGGYIEDNRVDGCISVSRTLGDLEYKKDRSRKRDQQKVIPHPEIEELDRNGDVSFVIIACDGIWDCMSSKEVIDYFKTEKKAEKPSTKKSKIIESLMQKIIAKDTSGNYS